MQLQPALINFQPPVETEEAEKPQKQPDFPSFSFHPSSTPPRDVCIVQQLEQTRRLYLHTCSIPDTSPMANLQHPLGPSAAAHSAAATTHLNPHTITSSAVDSDSEASLIHLTPRPSQANTPAIRHIEDDSRRCWVCYSTEAEDALSPQPHGLGEWKSPCRCSLVAHEKCLLNWIAAEYAKGGKAKIECPQCKHRIRFKQERSVALEVIDGVVRVANATVPLIILCGMYRFSYSWASLFKIWS